MEPATPSIALAAATLIYRSILLLNDEDVEFSTIFVQVAEKPIVDWAHSQLKKIGAKQRTLRTLTRRMTVFDLMGVCWSEYMKSVPEQQLELAFGSIRDPQDRFDALWFADVISDDIEQSRHAQLLKQSDAKAKLADFVAREIADELRMNIPDDFLKKHCRDAIAFCEERMQTLTFEMPELREVVNAKVISTLGRKIDQIHERLIPSSDHAIRVAQSYCRAVVGSEAQGDVFGRNAESSGLPLMPLAAIYVEPYAYNLKDRKTVAPVKRLLHDPIHKVNGQSSGLIAISAPFGYGKSLTCRSLAMELAQAFADDSSSPFPVLLQCPDVMTVRSYLLDVALEEFFVVNVGMSRMDAADFMSKASICVILDSFDEIALTDEQAKGWFQQARKMSRRMNVSVIVTSRPFGFDTQWLKKGDWHFEFLPFTDSQIDEWLSRARSYIDMSPSVDAAYIASRVPGGLLRIPILLLLAAWSGVLQSHNKLTRAEVYDLFFSHISQGKWLDVQEPHETVERGVQALGGSEAFTCALEVIAWASRRAATQGKRDGISKRDAIAALSASPFLSISEPYYNDVFSSIALSVFTSPSGSDSGRLIFSHQSFAEFLCAKYILRLAHHDLKSRSERGDVWMALGQVQMSREIFVFAAHVGGHKDAQEWLETVCRTHLKSDPNVLFYFQDQTRVAHSNFGTHYFSVRGTDEFGHRLWQNAIGYLVAQSRDPEEGLRPLSVHPWHHSWARAQLVAERFICPSAPGGASVAAIDLKRGCLVMIRRGGPTPPDGGNEYFFKYSYDEDIGMYVSGDLSLYSRGPTAGRSETVYYRQLYAAACALERANAFFGDSMILCGPDGVVVDWDGTLLDTHKYGNVHVFANRLVAGVNYIITEYGGIDGEWREFVPTTIHGAQNYDVYEVLDRLDTEVTNGASLESIGGVVEEICKWLDEFWSDAEDEAAEDEAAEDEAAEDDP